MRNLPRIMLIIWCLKISINMHLIVIVDENFINPTYSVSLYEEMVNPNLNEFNSVWANFQRHAY